MKKRPLSAQFGFSMLEALISTLIVAVALLGLAKINGEALIGSSDSRMKTQAQNLAQEKIEELRSFPRQQVYAAYSGTDSNTAEGVNATFTRTWTISNCANSVTCKQADVVVAWTDPRGGKQSVRLVSNIAEGDPVKSGVALLPPPTAPTDCTFNGQTVASGSSVTAYQKQGATCVSETRTCNTRQLTGSYELSSCANDCTLTDGSILQNGLQVNLYAAAKVAYPNTCLAQAQLFTCLNGSLLPLVKQVTDTLSGLTGGLTGQITDPLVNTVENLVGSPEISALVNAHANVLCKDVCIVPVIDGIGDTSILGIVTATASSKASSAIIDAGLTVGSVGKKGSPGSINGQSPAGGSEVDCKTAVSYNYK